MKLTHKRFASTKGKSYTIGRLYLNGAYFGDSLEPQWRDLKGGEPKVAGKTAIPEGTYKIIMKQSPKFGRMLPTLLNVPQFKGILIHRGNTAKDTAGCILVGENREVGKVLNSTYYEQKLVEILKHETNISITIS